MLQWSLALSSLQLAQAELAAQCAFPRARVLAPAA